MKLLIVSQHFYPENFRINDPGSNSRVNLQQFLDAYPVFYKFFHYNH